MSEHGTLMERFLDNVKDHHETLMIIEDEDGHRFGGFCAEMWKFSKEFYGFGDNFVFTF